MKNKLSIVIPSRNASNLLTCVFSILANEDRVNARPRIIVVDDGLEYANAEQKQYIISNTEIVKGEKPFVFSRNCNIGIRMAGDDDVILMNDDALLKSPGGFSLMKIMATASPEFGVVSSSCNNVGNINQHRRIGNMKIREDDRMVCFVCVLIPRSTIRTVGELDERFIHYGMDDDDYCLRVRNAGMKIGIFDGCYVDHGTLASTYRDNGTGDFKANLEIFKQKWGHDNWGVPA